VLFDKALRINTIVNRWHADEHESVAMWRLYNSGGYQSVAVRSTVAQLRACLPAAITDTPPSKLPDNHHEIHVVEMRYIDYGQAGQDTQQRNMFAPTMYKRREFGHEREIRAMVRSSPPWVSTLTSGVPTIPEWDATH
jgi:hypothetical protein